MCRRLTSRVADDGVLRCLDHGGLVDVREATIDEVELVELEEGRHDGLHLHVGERLTNAAVTTSTKRHVAELLLTHCTGRVKEPATTTRV